ncbi:MAG: hypothetical protein LC113_08735 [Acidobacteria bacterium]|nr:hypothetical protein [Acidobacteriota bacterium]
MEPIQGNHGTADKILFRGENMTVTEGSREDLKQPRFGGRKESCLTAADEDFKRKLSELNVREDTEYFEFAAEQTYERGAAKFTVKVDRELFLAIEPNILKKLDQSVGFTVTRNLYLLKNGNSSYLLLIGPGSATSGMGHLYGDHLLLPLDANRSAIEFESISDDPRRVRLTDSGSICYVKIDPPYMGAVKESRSRPLRLTASVFLTDGTRSKQLGSSTDFSCTDMEEIYDDQK